VRVRIIQALLPSNIEKLDPSAKGVLELALAKSLGYPQTSSIADELSNLENDGIIKRTKDTSVQRQNRCQLNQNRQAIKKIYHEKGEYQVLRPHIRDDFSGKFVPAFIERMSKEFTETILDFSKKSDFLFTIIVENSTAEELSSTYSQYLDTYQLLGIGDKELRVYWLWYLLMAQSFRADAMVDDLEYRQQMFKKMSILIKNKINDRITLQKNSDNVRLIQSVLQNSSDNKIISSITEKCKSYLKDLEKYEDEGYSLSREKLKETLLGEYQRIEAQLKMNQGRIS
jgi:hypothetical protein